MVTKICPGFIADPLPLQHCNDDRILKGNEVRLLQLDGLTFGSDGELWVTTDPSDSPKLGYEIDIHVSFFISFGCVALCGCNEQSLCVCATGKGYHKLMIITVIILE